jgi:hypothetical protein
MRLPRPRFTVRRLMVVVAVAAIVLGAARYKRGIDERARLATLKAGVSHAEARMAWAEAMERGEYAPKGAAAKARKRWAELRAQVKELEGR